MTDALAFLVPAAGEVRCRDCGRILTDPDSRIRGRGPECWGKSNVPMAGRRTAPAPEQAVLPIPSPRRGPDITTWPWALDPVGVVCGQAECGVVLVAGSGPWTLVVLTGAVAAHVGRCRPRLVP